MGGKYLDDWEEFEKYQKAGRKGGQDGAEARSFEPKGGSSVSYFDGGKAGHVYGSCHKSHPALAIPGTDKVIYGGSCLNPSVTDADVYIGFDMGMRFSERSYPWKKGYEFLFPIHDMEPPSKPEEFRKLVAWTRKQLDEGMKVHCGCIGGHGRTGTFFAALCADAGEKDAISYVRKNYCKKAVESNAQVAFLEKHFGVAKVDGYKESAAYKSSFSTPAAKGKGKKGGGGVTIVAAGIEKFSPMPQPFTLIKPCN